MEVVFLIIYLSSISYCLVIGALAIGLILPLLSNAFGKKINHWQTMRNEAQARQDANLLDILQGNEVIRTYKLQSQFMSLYLWQLLSTWSGWLGFWIGQLYILSMGAWLVLTQQMEIGIIAALMISYERLIFPLGGLVNQWAVVQDTLAHGRRVVEMVDPNESQPIHRETSKSIKGSSLSKRNDDGFSWSK